MAHALPRFAICSHIGRIMKRIGILVFEDGWCGGNVFAGQLPSEVTLKINRRCVPATPCMVHGEDYDHGHVYRYNALDFELQLSTQLGIVAKSLRELLSERKFRKLELFIES